MKVQLQGQSLRLRIDEAELAQLRGGKKVANATTLPGPGACIQRLSLGELLQAEFSGDAADWYMVLPRAQVEDYVERLPCKQGLAVSLPLPSGDVLEVEFEVDVRDSAKVRGKAKR